MELRLIEGDGSRDKEVKVAWEEVGGQMSR